MKELQVSEVKVIYETIKNVRAKNDLPFSRQWKFREVERPYKEYYEQFAEDTQKLMTSGEKDMDEINVKYRELLQVKVQIDNPVSLPLAWFEEKDAEGKQIIINGEEQDILLAFGIIEVEEPKEEKEEQA